MKEEIDKKHESKTFYLYTGIVITIICSVLLIGLFIYCYWKSKITDEAVGYNPINSVIAFLALILNILTVIFVYATYQTQRDTIKIQKQEIEDNKKDVEFNRALDIVYKQLEHSKERFIITDEDYERLYINQKHNDDLFRELDSLKDLLFWYRNESFFYIRFLNSSPISKSNKTFLIKVFINNIPTRFRKIIQNLRAPLLSKSKNSRDLYEMFIIKKLIGEFSENITNGFGVIDEFEKLSPMEQISYIRTNQKREIGRHLEIFDAVVKDYCDAKNGQQNFLDENKET